eukprot:3958777-Alexandrium_andersonii.AAC.1
MAPAVGASCAPPMSACAGSTWSESSGGSRARRPRSSTPRPWGAVIQKACSPSDPRDSGLLEPG